MKHIPTYLWHSQAQIDCHCRRLGAKTNTSCPSARKVHLERGPTDPPSARKAHVSEIASITLSPGALACYWHDFRHASFVVSVSSCLHLPQTSIQDWCNGGASLRLRSIRVLDRRRPKRQGVSFISQHFDNPSRRPSWNRVFLVHGTVTEMPKPTLSRSRGVGAIYRAKGGRVASRRKSEGVGWVNSYTCNRVIAGRKHWMS